MRLAEGETLGRFSRFAFGLLIALLAAGCFQPLYGSRTAGGGKNVKEALRRVEVAQILAPAGTDSSALAVQIRNDLVFNLGGGAPAVTPTHRLIVKFGLRRTGVIGANVAEIELYRISASYSLIEIATRKAVVNGTAGSAAATSVAGGQRFARTAAMRTAGKQTSQEIASEITRHLESYFFTHN